jgi:hypothetical protein
MAAAMAGRQVGAGALMICKIDFAGRPQLMQLVLQAVKRMLAQPAGAASLPRPVLVLPKLQPSKASVQRISLAPRTVRVAATGVAIQTVRLHGCSKQVS